LPPIIDQGSWESLQELMTVVINEMGEKTIERRTIGTNPK
jgi:hypothetical protein